MIYYLSLREDIPCRDYWDYGILECLNMDGKEVRTLPVLDSAVVVLPARSHAGYEDQLNAQLSGIKNVVLFLMGDEEAQFDVDKIKHDSINIWVQNPHMGKHDAYHKLGTGYTPQSQIILPNLKPINKRGVFFAGQITHQRREELQRVLKHYKNTMKGDVDFHPSAGFTQGLKPQEYYVGMVKAIVAPAPSGAVIPDSFRLFEALESMTIPIADQRCANGNVLEYWDWLFDGETPFYKVVDWNRLPSLVNEILANYPANLHRQTAWWLMWKRNFRNKVKDQLGLEQDKITVIIPTSVLPSHPSTAIIDQTIKDIRIHLPTSEIILQIDGLRDEQTHRKVEYNEYKNTILWKCLHEWDNVLPVVFGSLHHQSGMLRETIDLVRSPLVLYVEGDAPLTPDKAIDWNKCIDFILDGKANTIRFHHENVIPVDHLPLIIGEVDEGFLKTIQWSQRPNLSTKMYYKEVILPTLPKANFIEDTFHGVVQDDFNVYGMPGWNKHRLWIYHPDGGIQRSYTTDGRAGGKKYTSDDETWGL